MVFVAIFILKLCVLTFWGITIQQMKSANTILVQGWVTQDVSWALYLSLKVYLTNISYKLLSNKPKIIVNIKMIS